MPWCSRFFRLVNTVCHVLPTSSMRARETPKYLVLFILTASGAEFHDRRSLLVCQVRFFNSGRYFGILACFFFYVEVSARPVRNVLRLRLCRAQHHTTDLLEVVPDKPEGRRAPGSFLTFPSQVTIITFHVRDSSSFDGLCDVSCGFSFIKASAVRWARTQPWVHSSSGRWPICRHVYYTRVYA